MNKEINANTAAEEYADEFWDKNSRETIGNNAMLESDCWDAAKINFENGYKANPNQFTAEDMIVAYETGKRNSTTNMKDLSGKNWLQYYENL